MKFLCDHQPECSKENPKYWCFAEYTEIYTEDGLHEIVPSDSEPTGFACCECGATAVLEADATTKKQRKGKAKESAQKRLL